MKVSSITENKIITPKTTGYTALAAVGLTAASRISKNKNLHKAHKPISCAAILLTVLHASLIEYYHHKFKAKQL